MNSHVDTSGLSDDMYTRPLDSNLSTAVGFGALSPVSMRDGGDDELDVDQIMRDVFDMADGNGEDEDVEQQPQSTGLAADPVRSPTIPTFSVSAVDSAPSIQPAPPAPLVFSSAFSPSSSPLGNAFSVTSSAAEPGPSFTTEASVYQPVYPEANPNPVFVAVRSPPYSFTTPHTSKPPPPSYDAVASSTPSMHARSGDVSPVTPVIPYYTSQVAATANHDTLLVRNGYGVFLLRPAVKPAPPYTPPINMAAATATPPSPLPQYHLPPSAVPHVGRHPLSAAETPKYGFAVPSAKATPTLAPLPGSAIFAPPGGVHCYVAAHSPPPYSNAAPKPAVQPIVVKQGGV